MIKWNFNVKLVLADVDETIADVYTEATDEMISCLNKLLSKNIVLFLVSGGGLQSIKERITDKLDANLRHKVLIAHCSGAEVWGFQKNGNLKDKPFYGVYDEKMTEEQKKRWREIIAYIIDRYKLKTYPTMSRDKFVEITKGDKNSIMLADRGPQITLEFTNSEEMRQPILDELKKIYEAENFPVSPKLAGVFALDNPLIGVDKTYAIKYVLNNEDILKELNLPINLSNKSEMLEIWGDKFVLEKGGTDFLMCKAVPQTVRALDFRPDEKDFLPKDYNIVIWDGEKKLHEGLLEYLNKSL